MAQLKNTTLNDTGFLQLPVGTTGQRPDPAAGQMRFNTSTGKAEFYNATAAAWVGTAVAGIVATGGNSVYDVDVEGTTYRVHVFTSTGNSTFNVSKGGRVEYLIVAGGGSGGSGEGNPAGDGPGGGGAGGLLTGFTTVTPQAYTITVGAGASIRVTGPSQNGRSGADSSAFSLTAIGGGAGAREEGPGFAGGSGGGGGGSCISGRKPGGAGTAGQGNAGGTGGDSGCSRRAGAGGGGAGIAGGDDRGALGGNGGNGLLIGISGFNVYYAGGGGGGNAQNNGGTPGAGGLGGGGTGGTSPSGPGTDATPNTGGGGGATGSGTSTINGLGGDGIVIVRYPLNQENPVTSLSKISNNGLLLDLDFSKAETYVGSGTTISDSRFNGLSGSFVNTVTPRNIKTHRGCVEMFGDGGYIQMTQTRWGELPAYTVAYWAQRDVESRMVIGGSDTRFYWFGDNSWRYTHASSGEFYYPTGVSIPVGTWGYYVATYDGSAVRIYRQGVLEGSQNTTGTANFDLATFRFGYYNGSNTYAFDGLIGSIQIYSRALSTTEVAQYYNATRWKYGV